MKNELIIIILAAGKGKRMESDIPKVLHELNNVSLIERVINTSKKVNPEKILVVVGHQREKVIKKLENYSNLEFVIQKEQKGTAHAVKMCLPNLKDFKGDVLILSGDVPLISKQTLKDLISIKNTKTAKASLLTAIFEDPTGYGRVIRNSANMLAKIVEHKDCDAKQLEVNEINAGIYVFDNKMLLSYISKIGNQNAQNEFYLPDIINIMNQNNHYTAIHKTHNINEIKGINNKEQLLELNNHIIEREKN